MVFKTTCSQIQRERDVKVLGTEKDLKNYFLAVILIVNVLCVLFGLKSVYFLLLLVSLI
jgi:uncharacterized membrane protein